MSAGSAGQKGEIHPAARTLVCFAVKEECRYFLPEAARTPELEILITGMGWRNAEAAIRAALAKGAPRLVLSCGFAGGLNPELGRGTVVFAAERAASLEAPLIAAGAKSARFYCAERVAATAAQKRALRGTSGADAVDMESQVIHDCCAKQNVPSATVRVILDMAAEDLVLDFNDLMTEDQRIDNRKLALTLMKAPGKIGALLAFKKQSEAAARRLAEVLENVLKRV
jgi:nucleoside phosphorylase